MPMYSFECPECKHTIKTQFLKPGEKAQCMNCQASVVVPEDADSPVLPGDNISRPSRVKPAVKSATVEFPGKKYPALSILSSVYKILGLMNILIALIGIAFGVSLLDNLMSKQEGVLIIFGSLLVGAISAVTLFAISEGLKLGVDIEENSRQQIKLLEKIASK